MTKKQPRPERTARRSQDRRVTMTTTGLHTLVYFVDRLGHPDEVDPDSLAFAWSEAGAILIIAPDRERCALRDDHAETFFELFGWCVYHSIEVDLLSPEEFEEGFDSNGAIERRIEAATFANLSAGDVAAFQDVVRRRGGICMPDRKFHDRMAPTTTRTHGQTPASS